jgi:hypothetical protein
MVNPTVTMTGLDGAFWNHLLERIQEGEVIPVVGSGAVTFGRADTLLYPWLAERLPHKLDLTLTTMPRDLQEVVDAQRAEGKPVDRIYKHLFNIVEDPNLRPGLTLAALASIEGFRLFISTTFDSLLPRAVESASPGGKSEERQGAATLRGACPDLPQELAKLKHRFVYQILGRAEPLRDSVVWDDDMLHFLLRLNQQLPLLPKLSEALQNSHLLVLGVSFTDWILRFFVQVVKQRRLSDLATTELFIFEKLDPADRDKVVVYFSRLTKQIRILAIDPLEFIAELHTRWRETHPALTRNSYDMNKEHREKHRARGCIFVSYASPDLEIARYVVSQLQKAGCLVWFDKEQIQPGEKWKTILREAVEERCGLFVSIISKNTAERLGGYNIFERNLAAERSEILAQNATFYIPMRIDDGEPLIPDNEPHGTKRIQGVSKPGGHLDENFIGYLREKQRENCQALRYPAPPA